MTTIEIYRTFALDMPDATDSAYFDRASFRVKNKIFAALAAGENVGVLKLAQTDQAAVLMSDPETFFLTWAGYIRGGSACGSMPLEPGDSRTSWPRLGETAPRHLSKKSTMRTSDSQRGTSMDLPGQLNVAIQVMTNYNTRTLTKRLAAASAAFMLSLSANHVSAQSGNPSASAECASETITERLSQVRRSFNFPELYDGIRPLKSAPTRTVSQPATPPICALLSVELVNNGGEFFVKSSGSLALSDERRVRRRSQEHRQIVNAATQVLRETINQDVFPASPGADGRYIVAIPLHPGHALYATRDRVAAAATFPSTSSGALQSQLARGWRNAVLVGRHQGAAVFRLGQRNQRWYYAVLREVSDTEPLIDTVPTEVNGLQRLTYGPSVTERFDKMIKADIKPTASGRLNVEVWHYVEGFRAQRNDGTPFQSKPNPLQNGGDIEPPVAIERWEAQRMGSTQPFEWFAGRRFGGVGTPAYNSLAEIRALQTKTLERNALAAAARRERNNELDRQRRARRQAADELESRRRQLHANEGLVYLGPVFWDSFDRGAELRAVFMGDFPNARQAWEFGTIYQRVVTAFHRKCAAHIPPGSPSEISTEYEVGEFDSLTVLKQEQIFIRRAWFEPYVWWDQNDSRALATLPTGMSLAAVGQYVENLMEGNPNGGAIFGAGALLTRFQAGLRNDIPRLFAAGCTSPMLNQFQENMRRIALGLPSLQAEKIPAAMRDWSDVPSTFREACERDLLETGGKTGRDWCPCLDRLYSSQMTAGERWPILEDYSSFFQLVYTPPENGPADPAWRIYEPANQCRQ